VRNRPEFKGKTPEAISKGSATHEPIVSAKTSTIYLTGRGLPRKAIAVTHKPIQRAHRLPDKSRGTLSGGPLVRHRRVPSG
jgi:hypothetical protein